MSWRDVPMPDRIQMLTRTRSGLPVPKVAMWSSEKLIVGRDPVLERHGWHGPASVVERGGGPGRGRPVLGQMDPHRQRVSMLDLRCQVCNRELGDRRTLQPSREAPLWLCDLRVAAPAGGTGRDERGQTMAFEGKQRPLILEPWVCEPCLEYALQVCPGLIGQQERHDQPLRLLLVDRGEPVVVQTSLHGHPCAGYVKMMVVEAFVTSPEKFLAARVELREQAA